MQTMVEIIRMLPIDVFSKTRNPARKPLLWFFLIPVKNNEKGKASIDIASLANFAPMPTLDCIVRHLALFCCEDCADIGGAVYCGKKVLTSEISGPDKY
jgi:hypothetical protein